MYLSELEKILKNHREEHGDVNISFNRADDNCFGYSRCDVDINFNYEEMELNITVI